MRLQVVMCESQCLQSGMHCINDLPTDMVCDHELSISRPPTLVPILLWTYRHECFSSNLEPHAFISIEAFCCYRCSGMGTMDNKLVPAGMLPFKSLFEYSFHVESGLWTVR